MKWHRPDDYAKFPLSEFELSLLQAGNDVEEVARVMFPGGYLIEKRSPGARELTAQLMAERHPVIFQAVFGTEDFLSAADIVVWNEAAGMYDLYEVKMSTAEEADEESDEEPKVNKKKEERFENDLAFQVNVARMCGVSFNKKYLVRLNRKYVRAGEIDLEQMFLRTEKSEILSEAFLSDVELKMRSALIYLRDEKEPAGPCECYYKGRSSHCTTFSLSNPDVPEYSVHDLNRIGNSKKYLKELLDEGVLHIRDVPEDDRLRPKPPRVDKDGILRESKPRKLNQVLAHKTGQPIVDMAGIRDELSRLRFPLYFLDYETYPTPIPPFDGYRPYQHIVFQYSLNILPHRDAKLEHRECLVLEGDPSRQIVEGLRRDIGDIGTIISWNKKFENSRNKELAALLPEYSSFLHGLVERTYDLMDIVEQQMYVHPDFRGSSSIKKVQPVLAPHYSYKKLGVKNGTDAIDAYRKISTGIISGADAELKRQEMLEYCRYDTEVMYEIWAFFMKLVSL